MAILCTGFLSNELYRTLRDRSGVIDQSRREVENLTWVASWHAEATFLLVNTILTGLIERVERDGVGAEPIERLRGVMSRRRAALPLLEDLVLTDASGVTIVDGWPVTPRINLGDREYFARARGRHDDQPYIGIPVRSRLTNRWIIPVARRVNDASGNFSGVVIATVEVKFFMDFYTTLRLGHTGAAALLRDDGLMLIRQPPPTLLVIGNSANATPFHYLFPEALNGTFEVASPLDGFTKIGGYRRLTDYSLVFSLTLGKDEQLEGWRAAAIEHLVSAALVTLVLSFVGYRLVIQRQQAMRAAEQIALSVAATNEDLMRLSRHLVRARDRAEQANRAKSRFLAGMSHELRTPLNGILGYAQILHIEGGLNGTQARRVDAMLQAGRHLLQMINQVLDLSEIEAEHVVLQETAFDVAVAAEACLDVIRPMATAKGLGLSIVVPPDIRPEVITDLGRLRQVILNLLGNAVKFTSHGTVQIRLRSVSEGTALRIEIVDSGPGIPADHRQRLFKDFERLDIETTSSIEGSGLGLSLSARLMGMMGGRIGYDDNAAGGSIFWLELPATQAASAASETAPGVIGQNAEHAPASIASLHVLVVDGALMNRTIASAFLHAAGHRVTCAEDGAEAVATAAHADFDVVLMDVRMPKMDGLEATRQIRALEGVRSKVPIVALTGQTLAGQMELCRRAGMNSHLGKPFDCAALLAAVAHAVDARNRPGIGTGLARSWPDGRPVPAMLVAEHTLPIANPAAFKQTAGFLTPAVIAASLKTIMELGDLVLVELGKPDALGRGSDELAAAAHTLAGTAGMFGFERLSAAGRAFEHAVQSGAEKLPILANELRRVIILTHQEIGRKEHSTAI